MIDIGLSAEASAREAAGSRGAATGRPSRIREQLGDDRIVFVEITAHDLGDRAVREPDLDVDGLRFGALQTIDGAMITGATATGSRPSAGAAWRSRRLGAPRAPRGLR